MTKYHLITKEEFTFWGPNKDRKDILVSVGDVLNDTCFKVLRKNYPCMCFEATEFEEINLWLALMTGKDMINKINSKV